MGEQGNVPMLRLTDGKSYTEALCAVNLADVKCGCHEENTRMSDYLFLYFLTGLENHAPRMSCSILGWIV